MSFELRMSFLALLRRLSSSQRTLEQLVGFVIRPEAVKSAEDIWDCLMVEMETISGSLWKRAPISQDKTNPLSTPADSLLNMLHFLDFLLQESLSNPRLRQYPFFVQRDLEKIVELIVPGNNQQENSSEITSITSESQTNNQLSSNQSHSLLFSIPAAAVLNLQSTRMVISTWKTKRLMDPQVVDRVLVSLDSRKSSIYSSLLDPKNHRQVPKPDIFKRVENDRERHKRIRERIWTLPISPIIESTPKLALLLPMEILVSLSTRVNASIPNNNFSSNNNAETPSTKRIKLSASSIPGTSELEPPKPPNINNSDITQRVLFPTPNSLSGVSTLSHSTGPTKANVPKLLGSTGSTQSQPRLSTSQTSASSSPSSFPKLLPTGPNPQMFIKGNSPNFIATTISAKALNIEFEQLWDNFCFNETQELSISSLDHNSLRTPKQKLYDYSDPLFRQLEIDHAHWLSNLRDPN